MENLLSYSSTVLSLGFAGRLGPAALSAFALSHAVTNISGAQAGAGGGAAAVRAGRGAAQRSPVCCRLEHRLKAPACRPSLRPRAAHPSRSCLGAGIALTNGITCSIDTFSSQAHGGAHFAAIGATLQKGLALSLAACVPLMALYWWSAPVLLALGQEAQLVAAAARYIRLFSGARAAGRQGCSRGRA